MSERPAFDAGDPVDALADAFRRRVAELVIELTDPTIFRELSVSDQLTAAIAGISTGLIGVAFAKVADEGRDEVMRYIIEQMPLAREQAEGILD